MKIRKLINLLNSYKLHSSIKEMKGANSAV